MTYGVGYEEIVDSDNLRRRLDDDGGRLLVAMEQVASVVGPDFFSTAAELLKVRLGVRFEEAEEAEGS